MAEVARVTNGAGQLFKLRGALGFLSARAAQAGGMVVAKQAARLVFAYGQGGRGRAYPPQTRVQIGVAIADAFKDESWAGGV